MSETFPSKRTHGIACGPFACHLNGQPFGLAAEHDPAYTGDVVPVEVGRGAGVQPLSLPAHQYREERITIEFDDVTAAQFAAYRDVVTQATTNAGDTCSYSPLGETTYTSTGWTLVSTLDGWVETRHGRWSGTVALAKRGSTY